MAFSRDVIVEVSNSRYFIGDIFCLKFMRRAETNFTTIV